MRIIKKGFKELGFCAVCGGNCDNRCGEQCLIK